MHRDYLTAERSVSASPVKGSGKTMIMISGELAGVSKARLEVVFGVDAALHLVQLAHGFDADEVPVS